MKRIAVLALLLVMGLSLMGLAAGRVAVLLDEGGSGDLSFNDMGFKGTNDAAADFDVELTVLESDGPDDYLPNVSILSEEGYDLIICVGFLLADALTEVAPLYPDQKYAIIDGFVVQPNVMTIVFRENEMSALVGALAAMIAAHYDFPYVGMVLGYEISVLWHFEAGFRYGIDWGTKRYNDVMGTDQYVGLLYDYTDTFSDVAKGYAASTAQLALGAAAIYNVAGPLGEGDLQAVTEFHQTSGEQFGPPYFIGVDSNQDWMSVEGYGIASGMKRVDNATYFAVESVVNGTFDGGIYSWGLIEEGVGISRYPQLLDFMEFGIAANKITDDDVDTIIANWSRQRMLQPDWFWCAVNELEAGIRDGSIVVPTADTTEEMEAVRAAFPLE